MRGTAQVELSGVTAPQPWFLFVSAHCVDAYLFLRVVLLGARSPPMLQAHLSVYTRQRRLKIGQEEDHREDETKAGVRPPNGNS